MVCVVRESVSEAAREEAVRGRGRTQLRELLLVHVLEVLDRSLCEPFLLVGSHSSSEREESKRRDTPESELESSGPGDERRTVAAEPAVRPGSWLGEQQTGASARAAEEERAP